MGAMDFSHFHDIILLQLLTNAMDFSDDNKKLIKASAYDHPTAATAYLVKWRKYLTEMEKRVSKKIPVAFISEMFPGKYLRDVYLPGKVYYEVQILKLHLNESI